MSIIFQSVINTGKLYSLNKSLRVTYPVCKCLSVRKYTDVPRKFVTFDSIFEQRRAEAKRSLVVQVNSESSFSELYGYCSNYADIRGIHHYKNNGEEHFMLIEFNTEECLKDVLQSCASHHKEVDSMASQSPFLWFRAISKNNEKHKAPETESLMTRNGNEVISDENLLEELRKCSTVSDQIQLLYDRTKLNDLGIRLRYMVARHIEVIFDSLYANVVLRPFGSSVNGFGKMGSDLDLVLTNSVSEEMGDVKKRLVYQEKQRSTGRSGHLELAATLLEMRVAGATRVARILHARVPIVKFHHQLAAVDCDLCYCNTSGVYMSELLSQLGSLDPRTGPLSAAVRRWAAASRLTSPHPGRWVTGFPLTLMVLFFLQQDKCNVLPSVNTLIAKAGKEDKRITEDNLDCTFLRDMNKLPPDSYGQNKDNLEMLLLQFFEFYAQFNFQDKAISINEGKAIRKPNLQPLYIVNPLEPSLNVSRNVSYEECQKLQAEVKNAAWQLEAELEGKKSDEWGILGLIERKDVRGIKKILKVGSSHRLVSVKDLFTDDGTGHHKPEEQDKILKKEPLKFRNRQIANEVYRIRRGKML